MLKLYKILLNKRMFMYYLYILTVLLIFVVEPLRIKEELHHQDEDKTSLTTTFPELIPEGEEKSNHFFLESHQANLKHPLTHSKQYQKTLHHNRYSSLKSSSFNGLIIDSELPTTFISGEYYTIKGKVTSGEENINLIMSETETDGRYEYSTKATENREFSLLVEIPQEGKYEMFLFAGFRGSSDGKKYYVLPVEGTKAKDKKTPAEPKSANLELIENKLFLKWEASSSCIITKAEFKQSRSPNKIFILSNSVREFEVPFKEFQEYKEGSAHVHIYCANSEDSSLANRSSEYSSPKTIYFEVNNHAFSQIEEDEVKISEISNTLKIGENFVLKAKALTNLKNKVYLQTPNKEIKEFLLDESQDERALIRYGSSINFEIPSDELATLGVYIFELNEQSASASINVPVYVGEFYPLIPDFRDLEPKHWIEENDDAPKSLEDRRKLILGLVNEKREEWGVTPIELDNKLNSAAQAYAEDMIKRHFYGHYSPEGKGPSDRAKAAGVEEMVGENIAYNSNLTSAHYALSRSVGHLENIVKKDWTRVGLDISQDKEGTYYVVQLFSTRDMEKHPLDKKELADFESKITKGVAESCPHLSYDEKLTEILEKEWEKSPQSRLKGNFSSKVFAEGYRGYNYYWTNGAYREEFITKNIGCESSLENNCKNYKKYGFHYDLDKEVSIIVLFAK